MDDTQNARVDIPVSSISLPGDFNLPTGAKSLVIFAHGSGSSRLSPRNVYIADKLNDRGIGTLLFDLLTPQEDEVYETRFNIELLTDRLVTTTTWLDEQPETRELLFGYFGASTGAAAALKAAAKLGSRIKAVVSRGGRPDLAVERLHDVEAPTLLIVGGDDTVVIGLNKTALSKLNEQSKLEIVPGATHLFEEPGTLDEAANLAVEWFGQHLR